MAIDPAPEPGSLEGSITIISDDEPDCKADDTCAQLVEDALEETLGRNGTVNVTEVSVATTEGVGSGGRRLLLDYPGNRLLLRGAQEEERRRFLQASSNETETTIGFVSTPDESSNLTESQQAAEQINVLSANGLDNLLEELGLPADSNITDIDMMYTAGKAQL